MGRADHRHRPVHPRADFCPRSPGRRGPPGGGALLGRRPPRGGGPQPLCLGRLSAVLGRIDEPLYHAVANFNLPLTRVPGKRLVLTVHDLIPVLLPDTVSAAFRWQFRLWLSRSLLVADRVICVSRRTRDDLLARFEVNPGKVAVVYNGVDHVDRVPAPDPVSEVYLRTLALPPGFVLYAGALDARKNLGLVLEACARLKVRGRPTTLVVLGQSWFGSRAIEHRIATLRAEGLDVRPLGYQEAPLFYELMRRAGVFVFPSRYEGFGLPPLEAMRLGVPTIVSTAGSLPEVCGEGAVQVDPDDAEGLAGAIDRLLSSKRERSALAKAGRRQAALFTWKRCAQETLAVYEQALEGDD
ncbi:MAG: glycosyltransferase family 4 protein [Myxococcaceae bacterium]